MQRVIIVLGMHRSGTSALTGSLEGSGVYLGPVHRDEIEHNRKGLIELWPVMRMQEDLLKENGGSWFDPPNRVIWGTKSLERRDNLIAQYREQPIWGFKDPRTLFTVDGWLQALPSAEFIGIFRHPLAVAKSLMNRGYVEGGEFQRVEQAIDLWTRYNRRLLELQHAHQFPLLCFDVGGEQFKEDLCRAFTTLRLPRPLDPNTFFDADLRHFEAVSESTAKYVEPDARETYEALRHIADTQARHSGAS